MVNIYDMYFLGFLSLVNTHFCRHSGSIKPKVWDHETDGGDPGGAASLGNSANHPGYSAAQLGQLTRLLESSTLDISQCPSLTAAILRQRDVVWGKMTGATLLMTHRFEIHVLVYSSLR